MSNLSRKVVAVGLTLTTAVWFAGSVIPAFAQTSQSTIDALMAQIAALQAQIAGLQGQNSSNVPSVTFTRDLTLGSKGTDVTALQQFLVNAGQLHMPAGVAYGYFGALTKTAVAAWQKSAGVSATGYFGPKSRAAIALAGGGTVVTPGGSTGPVVVVPSGTDLVVAKAVNSPSDRTIGSGTAFNPGLVVNLTAGSKAVKVTGLTVFKSGFLANTSLNGVDVVDSKGVRHGNVISSVGADNTIVIGFPTAPVNIAAGTTETLTIRFNLATGALTGTVVMSLQSVASIAADTTAISGSFPISGGIMNVVNGGNSLASLTLDALTSTGSTTLNVDPASEQEITKFRIQETTSNEGTKLYSWTLYNYGNAGSADYSDVQLIAQNGTVLATAQPNGQYVIFDLSTNPYLIDKGMTKDFTVKARLIGGTTKTIQLVTYNNYDIDIRGIATGVSIIPAAGTNDIAFPIGNGFNIQTIGSGTITLSRAVDTPSAAVTPGTTDAVLAKYIAKPTGENMELRQIQFYVSSVSYNLTGTVYVKVNDQTVYSIAASSLTTSSVNTITLSTYPILTSGVNNTIVVTGSINSSATSADTYTVKSFNLIQAKRLVTNDLITPGTTAIDGLAIAVQAGKLTVTNLSTPSTQSVVKGTVGFEFAQIQFSAQGGGEDIKVSKVVITDVSTLSTDLANVVIYKDSDTTPLTTSASTASFSGASSGYVTFSFQTPFTVTRATPVILHVKADVTTSASTTPTHALYVKTIANDVTAYGATTGNTVSGSSLVASGISNAMSIASSGTLTLSIVSGSGATPSANQVVTAGTTGATYLAFKLTSQTETQKITSLKVSASGTSLATTTLKNIALYQDNTLVTTAGQWDACSGTLCTVTFTATDNLLPAAVPITGTTLYVKADVPAGGNGVTLGDDFLLKIAAAADIQTKGSVTAATTTATGTAIPTAVSYVAPQSVEIVAVSPTAASQVGLSSGQTIGVFQIINHGSAPIYLSSTTDKFTVTNGGSATTSVTFALYASAQGGTQSDTSITYATSSTSGGATGASSSIPFDMTASGVAIGDRTINGGSFRYITVKTTGVAANNDTFALSISSLGAVKYFVKESDLGYSGNPLTNSTINDTLSNMFMSGVPSLGTVTAKT